MVAALAFYQTERRELMDEHYAQLEAVGEANVRQIVDWRRERLADVRVTAGSPLIRDALEGAGRGLRDPIVREQVLAHLRLIVGAYRYSNALLTDRDGRLLLAASAEHSAIGPDTRALITRAVVSHAAAMSELLGDEPVTAFHADFAAPIAGPDGAASAVLILRSQPLEGLLPRLGTWPAAGRSGEMLMARPLGGDVVVIGPLGSRGAAPSRTIVPAESREVAAVQGAMRFTGRFAGLDHRGTQVLADLRPVPASPWSLVTATDATHIDSESAYRGGVLALLLALVALLTGGAVVTILGVRQRDLVRRIFRAESEREAVARHHTRISALARDGVFLFDASGRIVEANRPAERTYGYSAEELRKLRVHDLRVLELQPTLDADWAGAVLPGGVLFKTRHQRRDGSSFPVEVSSHGIQIDGEVYRHSIIRDITERERADRELRDQLAELRRWHAAGLDREARILELKAEVNTLLREAGRTGRYQSADSDAIGDMPGRGPDA
ncbi:hypothetical protein BH23CHL8_BH23CHL8_05410 [soil metagenome]